MANKTVFAASLNDLLVNRPERSTSEPVEAMVNLGEGIALNIRALTIKTGNRAGDIVPNCWLHTINEDGSTTPLMFIPIVGARYSAANGGHNETAFTKIFGKIWTELRQRARSQEHANVQLHEEITADQEVPF